MTRWKRVGISFAAALIAELLIALGFSVPDGRRLFFEHTFGFVYFASFLVIPGWLIALPIIVIPKKAIPLPIGLFALIGTFIGPTLMVGLGIYLAITNPNFFSYDHTAYYDVGAGTLVSGLTTALYLTTLRLFIRTTPTASP